VSDFNSIWSSQLTSLQAKNGFTGVPEEKLTFANGQARLLRYSYREGRYLRVAAMIVAVNPAGTAALRLDANGADTEGETVLKQLTAQFAQISIPAATATPNAAPSTEPKNEPKTGPKKPTTPASATTPRAPATTPVPAPKRTPTPQDEDGN
jgi:cytoskeletal protein RodZ